MPHLLASFAVFLAVTLAQGVAAQTPADPPAASLVRIPVWFAHDSKAVERFDENPAVSAQLVDRVVRAATGKADRTAAWRSLVNPGDRVGIKVSAAGGRLFSTRLGVVKAVLNGLETAGVKRSLVIIWDRDINDLRAAGFDPKTLGCQVRGIDLPGGWDRDAAISAPVLGKLIWGDLLFVEKASKKRGKLPAEEDQLSSTSHLARIVSREVTKIINIPVLSDAAGGGVGGAIYNMTVPNVDNWRRFTQSNRAAADSLPTVYMDEHIAPKVVLHLMDGLVAQYAGGPAANPNYAYGHATLYASRDPVALDATAFRLIEDWRREAKLPSIARNVQWLEYAEAMGLGVFSEEKIDLRPATPAP